LRLIWRCSTLAGAPPNWAIGWARVLPRRAKRVTTAK
jgi:hypothetical protein